MKGKKTDLMLKTKFGQIGPKTTVLSCRVRKKSNPDRRKFHPYRRDGGTCQVHMSCPHLRCHRGRSAKEFWLCGCIEIEICQFWNIALNIEASNCMEKTFARGYPINRTSHKNKNKTSMKYFSARERHLRYCQLVLKTFLKLEQMWHKQMAERKTQDESNFLPHLLTRPN